MNRSVFLGIRQSSTLWVFFEFNDALTAMRKRAQAKQSGKISAIFSDSPKSTQDVEFLEVCIDHLQNYL